MEKTILIVDDFASTRSITRFTLQKAGYKVLEASGGQEALQHLNAATVHLMITDLNMPKMDGLTLARETRLNPRHRYTPILILSTENKNPKKEEHRTVDVTGWITKPYTVENLLATIQKILR